MEKKIDLLSDDPAAGMKAPGGIFYFKLQNNCAFPQKKTRKQVFTIYRSSYREKSPFSKYNVYPRPGAGIQSQNVSCGLPAR